jgi:3-oxoacyl-[acyl-carrier protein] reductase
MEVDFSNKVVLVTGGTRGIGKAIAELFLENNAEVIATGTDLKNVDVSDNDSVKNKINYKSLDFSSHSSTSSFLKKLEDGPPIDILINNAGINKIDDISNINSKDWDKVNEINLRGPFILTKEIVKKMKSLKQGHIINIASIFGVVSKKKRSVYSTTKSGLIGFTKSIALDLAPYNIIVNSVSPGFVDTELTRKILTVREIEKIKKTIPLLRLAEADEIAKTIIFLCSKYNTYISGQNIIVDGGFTIA